MKPVVSTERVICLDCLRDLLGSVPDSLTWFFAVCWTCGGHQQVCAKTRHIPKLRSLHDPVD